MSIKVITEFLQGSTVRIRVYVYDDDGDLVDPTTSVTVDIWDSAGTKQVDGVAMTKVSTGIYEYYYNTSSSSETGSWRGIIWTVDGTYTSEGSFGFKVKS